MTIVMPVYNSESVIEETLDSVINQSVLPDELILIDDGSSDRSLEILESYNFDFPCSVRSIKNVGQGKARNLGVSHANGEYIYFLDSDDLIDPLFLEKMKKIIGLYKKPDLILFSGQSFNDHDYSGSRNVEYNRATEGYFPNRVNFLLKADHNMGLFCSPCMYVSKRKIWNDCELQFDSYYFEDESIFLRLIMNSNTFYITKDKLFRRRNRNGSVMNIEFGIKHYQGALSCVNNSLALIKLNSLHAVERCVIERRLAGQYVTLRKIADELNKRNSIVIVLKVLASINNFKIRLKVLFYYVGIWKVGRLFLMFRELLFNRK